MRFYKMVSNNYLLSVGTGLMGEEITESEYNKILAIIRSKPIPESGFDYRLTNSLEWERYELSPMEVIL